MKLSVSDSLNKTFKVFTANFMKVALPYLIYAAFYNLYLIKIPLMTWAFGPEFLSGFLTLDFIAEILLTTHLLYYTTKVFFNWFQGKDFQLNDLMKVRLNRICGLFLLSLLFNLIIGLGLILLIIPGLILSLGFMIVTEIYICEKGISITEAIRRSWKLTSGCKGEIFIINILAGIIPLIIGAIYAYVLYVVKHQSLIGYMDVMGTTLFQIPSTVIMTPFYTALSVSIYYNILNLKEGIELQQISDNFMNESPSEIHTEY